MPRPSPVGLYGPPAPGPPLRLKTVPEWSNRIPDVIRAVCNVVRIIRGYPGRNAPGQSSVICDLKNYADHKEKAYKRRRARTLDRVATEGTADTGTGSEASLVGEPAPKLESSPAFGALARLPSTEHFETYPLIKERECGIQSDKLSYRATAERGSLAVTEAAPDAIEKSPTVPNDRKAIHMVAPHALSDGGGVRSSSRSPGGALRGDPAANNCSICPQVLEHFPNRKVAVDKLSTLIFTSHSQILSRLGNSCLLRR